MIGTLAGLVVLAALIVGSSYGNVQASALRPQLVAWGCLVAVVAFGIVATSRLSTATANVLARRSTPSIKGIVKYTTAIIGYVIVALIALRVAGVSAQRLLVGAGIAGVVIGIAAQQSLGNIFAGMVLILAKPFVVGDQVRIRSGSLGGMFDAQVLEMSITYVTVDTEDGEFKIPNTALLAAAVGVLRHGTVSRAPTTPGVAKTGPPQPAPTPPPALVTQSGNGEAEGARAGAGPPEPPGSDGPL